MMTTYTPKRSRYNQSVTPYQGRVNVPGNGAIRKRSSKGNSTRGRLTYGGGHTNSIYPAPEVKFFDCDEKGNSPPFPGGYTPSAMTATGVTTILNVPTNSIGSTGYLGNQFSTKSVAYRIGVNLGATATPCNGRLVVVWDKQANGSKASYGDVFAATNYLAYMNLDNRARFVILRNEQFSLSPQGDQVVFFEDFVKINMLTTMSNSVSIPLSGALCLLFISDQTVTAQQPVMSGWFRTRFIDT